jgi:hypothetical protein
LLGEIATPTSSDLNRAQPVMLAEYRWQALAGVSFAFRLSSGHVVALRAIAPGSVA